MRPRSIEETQALLKDVSSTVTAIQNTVGKMTDRVLFDDTHYRVTATQDLCRGMADKLDALTTSGLDSAQQGDVIKHIQDQFKGLNHNLGTILEHYENDLTGSVALINLKRELVQVQRAIENLGKEVGATYGGQTKEPTSNEGKEVGATSVQPKRSMSNTKNIYQQLSQGQNVVSNIKSARIEIQNAKEPDKPSTLSPSQKAEVTVDKPANQPANQENDPTVTRSTPRMGRG